MVVTTLLEISYCNLQKSKPFVKYKFACNYGVTVIAVERSERKRTDTEL